jgi:hypothetical protein
MIDRVRVQGIEVTLEDDFEWVNAWAAADKPNGKPRDPQPIAPDEAPREEARRAAPREEKMPAVARNVETATQDDIVSAPRASAAAAALLLDAGSVVSPAATTVAAPAVAALSAAEPPPVAEAVPPSVSVTAVEEPATVTLVEELIFAFDAPPASGKASAEADEIIDLDLADVIQNTDNISEPPAETNAPISFFDAARRMGRWTNLFRMMTRSGTSSAAARDLFIAEAPPAAPSLDQPADGAEQETAADEDVAAREAAAAKLAAAKAKAAARAEAAQLARDIAEIVAVRDRLLAMPIAARPSSRAQPLLRTSDYVPILVGAVLAFTSLIVFGAAASFVSLR